MYNALNPPVAQLVEQLALNETVVGSTPTGRTSRQNVAGQRFVDLSEPEPPWAVRRARAIFQQKNMRGDKKNSAFVLFFSHVRDEAIFFTAAKNRESW